jgi:hypothetical protein
MQVCATYAWLRASADNSIAHALSSTCRPLYRVSMVQDWIRNCFWSHGIDPFPLLSPALKCSP